MDIMRELFNTHELTDLITSISEDEKKKLELDSCKLSFSDDHNLVVIEGPVKVISNLKWSIPFFLEGLKRLKKMKDTEIERQVNAEIAAYYASLK